jgi:nitrite reductase/ring-hydroxylating ferredoxin subunit
MPRFVEVAKKSQIPENGAIGVEVKAKRLALANLNGEIYAIDDDCPHEGGPLSEEQIIGEEIECPWHTSHFNIKGWPRHHGPRDENVAVLRRCRSPVDSSATAARAAHRVASWRIGADGVAQTQ